MRINKYQANNIKQLAMDYFGSGSNIYIFGSRADDFKKGGDIDIYVECNLKVSHEEIAKKRVDYVLDIQKQLGEQKIDLIVNNFAFKDKSYYNIKIFQVALNKGIKL
ncbi:MAG: nucleotidyltransferase domain-containing protein [bacterium]